MQALHLIKLRIAVTLNNQILKRTATGIGKMEKVAVMTTILGSG